MFQITFVESSDPVLEILRSRPDSVFGRPYAGYAVFLFGAADEDVATWFSRSIVSLDSLSADDVACVVFARKVRIEATAHTYLSPRPMFARSRLNDDGSVNLGMVNRVAGTRLVQGGKPAWSNDENTMTAATYAADDVARELGVLDRLPCVVFMDGPGRPGSEADAEVVEIEPDGTSAAQLVRLLRTSFQHLRRQQGFLAYSNALIEIEQLTRKIRELAGDRWDLERRADQLRSERSRKLSENCAHYDAALGALRDGSVRLFANAMRRVADIDNGDLDSAIASLTNAKTELAALGKTIGTIEFYALLQKWPLSVESTRRLDGVVERHVRVLLREVRCTPPTSRDECLRLLQTLKERQSARIEECLGKLERRDAYGRRQQEMGEASFADLAAQYCALCKEIDALMAKRTQHFPEQQPSLVAAVRAARDSLRIRGASAQQTRLSEKVALFVYGDLVHGPKYDTNINGSTLAALAVGERATAKATMNLGADKEAEKR